jgi:hypothetical protein
MLINSLLSHASDARWEEFISELERLNVRKAVVVRGLLWTKECRDDGLISLAAHVLAHHGGSDFVYSGFPGKHSSGHVSEENQSGGP